MRKKKFLIYSWKNELFGIAIEEVFEILELDDLAKTNLTEMKVTLWNGRTLPVIDPIAIFSIMESSVGKDSKIIVVEKKGLKFGFLVDTIFGVEEVDFENTELASVTEKRFILRIAENFKITDMSYFVDDQIKKSLVATSQINTNDVLYGEKAYEIKMSDKEIVMNELRMRILNLLIKAVRNKLDDRHVSDLLGLQKNIEKI
jgi:chemotaxis signal transduction protein